MSTILHIAASPNGAASASERIAKIFLDELARIDPSVTITTLPLFDIALPPFGHLATTAKFAPLLGLEVTPEQQAAWQPIVDHIRQFDAADRIVVSTPMWNGSIPYPLKHYLDLIVQPRLSFGYNRETMQHIGLLRNRPLQMIFSRSSVMLGDLADFQMPYLRYVFDLIGMRDLRVIAACRTTRPASAGPDVGRDAYIESFYPEARAAARNF